MEKAKGTFNDANVKPFLDFAGHRVMFMRRHSPRVLEMWLRTRGSSTRTFAIGWVHTAAAGIEALA